MLSMTKFLLPFLAMMVSVQAFAFDGLVASELPPGGDVTVPGDFPVKVPLQIDVLLSGVSMPQSLTLTARAGGGSSEVRVFSVHEKRSRTLRIEPGQSVVYNLKDKKPVRIRVMSGDVMVSSIQSLKVQR